MDTDNLELMKTLIKDRRSFRVGQRGICFDLCYNVYMKQWYITIPRALFKVYLPDNPAIVTKSTTGTSYLIGISIEINLSDYERVFPLLRTIDDKLAGDD